MAIPPIPENPTPTEVRATRTFIEDNLFVDFPFETDIDRAVAFAAMLQPFVRPLIAGPTPLYMFAAPRPGTGKTLLVQCAMSAALGPAGVAAMTLDCDEAEARKRLTASLRQSPTAILIDNFGQDRRLSSTSLASVLTTGVWSDRLLGSSALAKMPVWCTWLATANNPRLSDEMARRIIFCRLNARTTRPHMRGGFRHSAILDWAHAHRSELVGAALTLAQAWYVAGMPSGDCGLGMYESWARTMGGLLRVAGVDGLHAAIARDQCAATETEEAVTPLVHAWWKAHGQSVVGASLLFKTANVVGCLEDVLNMSSSDAKPSSSRQKTEKAEQTRFGIALRRLTGLQVAGYRVESAGTDHSGRQLYRLVPAD